MKNKFLAVACSAALISSLTGCIRESKDSSGVKSGDDVSSFMKTVTSSEDDSEHRDMTDMSETDESSDENRDDSKAPESSEEEFSGIPEDISQDLLYSHSASLSGFSKVKSNEKLEECLKRIDKICAEYGYSLAFSFENIDTGAQINYNSMKQFMTCSTIKAPYVKSILASGIDLNEKIVKDKNWIGDIVGEDYIASMEWGKEFTVKELIEAAIQRSDNTAYYLLEQHFGWDVFNNLQYQIGADYYVGSDWIFTYATTADMLKSYKDIYQFGEENEQGKWLTELMTDTDLNEQIGKNLSEKYKVSQKYGSEFNESVYNDCAIVYAKSPFVLCIFSEQPPETEESNQVFLDLADIFDEINSLIYIN